jgi:hypothetical protein
MRLRNALPPRGGRAAEDKGRRPKAAPRGLALLAGVLLWLALTGPAHAAFICKGQIFSEGDPKSMVYLVCGPPDYQEVVGEESRGGIPLPPEGKGRGTFQKSKEPVVQWVYNCGETHFLKILTFRGGTLVDVRSSEQRGWGENRRNCW